jgi:hypothetical protein
LVSDIKALKRIFGPKRDEVTGSWRKHHSVELHNLYSSPSIIRMTKSRRMNGKDMQHEWNQSAYRILVGKSEGKRPLRRQSCRRWADNIKLNHRCDGVVWPGLVWLRIGTSGGLL